MFVTSFLNSFFVPFPFRYFSQTEEPEDDVFRPNVLFASGRPLFFPSFFVTIGGPLEAVEVAVDVLDVEVSDDDEDEDDDDDEDADDDVEGLEDLGFGGTSSDLEFWCPFFLGDS